MSTNDTSTWYDGDVPTMSAPQSLADVVLGESALPRRQQAGVLTALIDDRSAAGRLSGCVAACRAATAVLTEVLATVQLILFGVYLTLFILYAALGELKKHSRVGQAALTASCVLNAVFSGFVFYESYLTAGSPTKSHRRFAD